MKYTFNNNGKQQTVNVPEDYIKKNRRALGISTQKAIDMYLSDEGYIVDPTVAELTAKAKDTTVRAKSGTKRKAPARKPDLTKRAIIAALEQDIQEIKLDSGTIGNVQVTNMERVIAFSIGDDDYEVTLSKKRKSKK